MPGLIVFAEIGTQFSGAIVINERSDDGKSFCVFVGMTDDELSNRCVDT